MSLVLRATAAACAAALALAALAGCSSSGDSPSAGPAAAGQSDQSGQSGQAGAGDDSANDAANDAANDDEGSGEAPSDGDDDTIGTVTVEIASGPHAGTYTREGDLQCASIGDGRWVVFAPGEGAADEVAQLSVYWMSSGIDRTVVDTPYPDDTELLDLKFGSPIATGDDAISISKEVGGTVEVAAPSFDESGRPIYHFVATTADGVDLKIAAAPTGCPPY